MAENLLTTTEPWSYQQIKLSKWVFWQKIIEIYFLTFDFYRDNDEENNQN